jgi:hypothetical protein
MRGCPPIRRLGVGITTPHHKNPFVTKCDTGLRAWTDSLELRKQRKMDLRGIRWNGVEWIDLAHDRNQRLALVKR